MFLVFQLYIALVRPIDSLISIPLHLCLAIALMILYKPLAKKYKKKWLWAIDIGFLIGLFVTVVYFIVSNERLTFRIMMVDLMTPMDLFVSFFMLLAIMEIVRRTIGLNLFIFIMIFIVYAFIGQYIGGPFRYSGMTWQQFAEMLTLSPDGIFGTPLATSLNILFYFLLFGAFFAKCGGGQVLIDMGMKLSDKTVGGPAKASVVSSSFMGMISGSAMANVSTTGVLTIPLMKKSGYTKEQSGAIEAVASTGGQIMPPIMGVGAFIMAEMIGISYVTIATAAIIPAAAYFLAIFVVVHLLAKKRKLDVQDEEIKYESEPIIPRLYQLIPIVVVVAMIFAGSSLTRAALIGVALSIVISLFSKKTRLSFLGFVAAALTGIRQAANIAIPTAAVGIMIGIVVRSGVANKLTSLIGDLGNGNLLVALLIAMLGCLLLGMALPTVAAYLISYILFVPTLISLGIPALPANMFIFYFGVVAQITPPVALAAFAAAGIAKADSWKTGWMAFSYALVAFIAPFVFVYQPEILLMGTVVDTVITTLIMCIGIIFLSGGVAGYFFKSLNNFIYRAVLVVIALLIITPETLTSAVGLVLGLAFGVYMYFQNKKDISLLNKNSQGVNY
ncbi:TRAP transporter fused permease subunit [Salinibacillus xinjiangensis]|uniref:TRAP transporter fused permease subunit n=1 Tax=Salinibacillus xinjiangensis TaxID=1229268 RepID=A0A6G1X298_9BACI|nr:TRAP transporter fused permease subunit [Salinibacillus xinjiangensis]